MALNCKDPLAVERWYSKHLGFRRARVYAPGPGQVVMIKRDDIYLELFPAGAAEAGPALGGDGPQGPGWRHLAFLVDDLDAKLAEMGAEARITLGPLDMGQFIPGMRSVWLADPEGNTVELNQGYQDEADLPRLSA